MADFPTPAGATRLVTLLLITSPNLTAVPDPITVYPFPDPVKTQPILPRLLVGMTLTSVPDPVLAYSFTSPLMSKWLYPATMAPAPPDPGGGGGETPVYDTGQIWPRGQGIAN